VIVRAAAKRPPVSALRFLDGKVVNVCDVAVHEPAIVERPIFIAIGAKPVAGVIVPLIGEAHGDACLVASPELLDEAIFLFPGPFAL
jgi:hypothetical protein